MARALKGEWRIGAQGMECWGKGADESGKIEAGGEVRRSSREPREAQKEPARALRHGRHI